MIETLKNITLSDAQQQNSLQRALEIGVPSMKNEEWKYTYYNKILQQGFDVNNSNSKQATFNHDQIQTFIENNSVSSNKLVFVDGIFQNDLSTFLNHPKINFWNNKNSVESNSKDFLLELNNALTTDGVFLEIGDNVIVEDLVEIFYLHTNSSSIFNLKNKIKIGKNTQAKFAEYFINYNQQSAYNNIVTEVNIDASANIEWYKIQDGGNSYNITDNMFIQQAEKSICNVVTCSFSGAITRNVLNIDVNGERTETHMNGLVLLLNNEHVDNRTQINHNVPNCESFELYKNILAGTSTGVFNGKINVDAIAQKTNAYQSNRNILLSNDANIYTKPQLEIYADDVKCSHGATSSQIEDSELFYLQTRGISKATARGLLVFAFGEEIVDKINFEPLRNKLEKRIAELLNIDL